MNDYESHVVAIPFPGRGHVNPMMNLCNSLTSRKPNLLITVVVTPEWVGLLRSEPKPQNICFASMPDNVIPPERLKAVDFVGFYEAVMTKMEAPFEEVLDRIIKDHPVATIIADVELRWGVRVGKKRNIPVAAFWTMSASVLSMFHRYNQNGASSTSSPVQALSCDEMSSEMRTILEENDPQVVQLCLECISWVPKAQTLLLTNVYELEPQAVDTMSSDFQFPVYTIGPAIPYLQLKDQDEDEDVPDYVKWLDLQPPDSVLYISLGSFLSVSAIQMDEIAAGLRDSGVRFLWVARAEASRLRGSVGNMGLVVSWCQQLRVLCHSSVGGFWTHCGWNSTLEAVFAGVPMLTLPLFLDQDSNSRQIAGEWKVGRRVREVDEFVTRDEVMRLVIRFMDVEENEGKEMRKRAKDLKDVCGEAIADGGSSVRNLDAFIRGISLAHSK